MEGVESAAAAAYDAWFERPWGRYAFAVERGAVLSALGPLRGRVVLDAGCGTGRFSRAIVEAGAFVVGLDRDRAALRLAAGRASAVACGDASALPFADETFDSCVAVTLCEFIDEPIRVVEELVRVARPGGRVIIGSLNRRSAWGLAHWRQFQRPPWTSAKFINQRQLEQSAMRLGRTRRRSALYAPGHLPCIERWGPLLERVGGAARGLAAFQLVIVDKVSRSDG